MSCVSKVKIYQYSKISYFDIWGIPSSVNQISNTPWAPFPLYTGNLNRGSPLENVCSSQILLNSKLS